MRILAIVPAFNEEKSIELVINDLKEYCPKVDILIINDCSKDNTVALALKAGAQVISLPCNLGIGGAVQTGFIYAKDNNYDIAFQFDGDGQHLANQVDKLLEPIILKKADMVIGSRFLNYGHYKPSLLRSIGINFFKFVNSFILNQKLTDNTSGFRAYNKHAIDFLTKVYPQDYPEVEAIVIMAKANFKIFELPVLMRERQGGKSSITSFKSAYYMIKVSFAIFFNLIRKHPSQKAEEALWS